MERELLQCGVQLEQFGGDIQAVHISALTVYVVRVVMSVVRNGAVSVVMSEAVSVVMSGAVSVVMSEAVSVVMSGAVRW